MDIGFGSLGDFSGFILLTLIYYSYDEDWLAVRLKAPNHFADHHSAVLVLFVVTEPSNSPKGAFIRLNLSICSLHRAYLFALMTISRPAESRKDRRTR
jgi:hypothetical protein